MKKWPLNQVIYDIPIFFCLCLFMFLPTEARALDQVLYPDSSGRLMLGEYKFVGKYDRLIIPAGTVLTIKPGASIIVEGELRIGVDSYKMTDRERGIDLLKGVKITSETTLAPIQIKGGSAFMFNINHSGSPLAEVYRSGLLDISSSTITSTSIHSMINVFDHSSIEIADSHFRGDLDTHQFSSNAVISVFNFSHATTTNVNIEGRNRSYLFHVFSNSHVYMEGGIFDKCETGLSVFNDSSARSFGGVFNCRNIYSSFNRGVVTIAENMKRCCSRVLFVPGLQGSRLILSGFKGFQRQVWEPSRNGDVEKLFLNEQGIPIFSNIEPKGIIGRISVVEGKAQYGLQPFMPTIYERFMNFLEVLKKDKYISGFSTFPYDWRFLPEGKNIEDLKSKIIKEAGLAENGKVTLVGHSYGGFLIKAVLMSLDEKPETRKLVDKVIYVAFPETGSPSTITSALHGDNQVIAKSLIMSAINAMKLAQYMPSAHMLAPSNYFSQDIKIVFKDITRHISETYSSTTRMNNSAGQHFSLFNIAEWLKGQLKESGLGDSDVNKYMPMPGKHIANSAYDVFTSIYRQSAVLEDSFNSSSIIGYGDPTLSGIEYRLQPCTNDLIKKMNISIHCDINKRIHRLHAYSNSGDGTVLFDGMDRRSGRDYILSMSDIRKGVTANITHSSIMESPLVQKTILSILKSTSTATSSLYESASGVGPEGLNPWINTSPVYGVDIIGDTKVTIYKDIFASTDNVASDNVLAVLDSSDGETKISNTATSDIPSIIETSSGWSIGMPGLPNDMRITSNATQDISIYLSKNQGSQPTAIEQFIDIPAGQGTSLFIDTAYTYSTPQTLVAVDFNGDGITDYTITSTTLGSDNQPTSPKPEEGGVPTEQSIKSYREKLNNMLDSISQYKLQSSNIQSFGLKSMYIRLLDRVEKIYVSNNPSLAMAELIRHHNWLIDIAKKYESQIAQIDKWQKIGTIYTNVFRLGPKINTDDRKQNAKSHLQDISFIRYQLKILEGQGIDLLLKQ